jgi:NADH-quinone oxidoreductase subunit F
LWWWSICGEETALLNHWKERGNSYQTTIPAISGLWANPTVVNNVETIAAVPGY